MNDLTLCSVMMVELWSRQREIEQEDENEVENICPYANSGV
jgi:hypothetical protein